MQFQRYWRERAKESFVKARVIAEAVIFVAFLGCGLLGLWLSKFPVDRTVWWSGFIVFGGWLIIEICFISPFNHAKTLDDKIIALEERMKPRIQVSCGRSVDKSVVKEVGPRPEHPQGGILTWFRARLELVGETPIPDLDPNVTELKEDGKNIQLQELLNLTMYPGKISPTDNNLRTLYPGRPEFIDVIKSSSGGKAVFPVKWYHGSVPYETLLKANHIYEILVVLTSPSHTTVTFRFEFSWTGNPDTSDIRLLSVTPPSLIQHTVTSQL